MNRPRLILRLAVFLVGSLELWAQRPKCYRSYTSFDGQDWYWVLIVSIPNTDLSNTVIFDEVGWPLPGYTQVITHYPDSHETFDGFEEGNAFDAIKNYANGYCSQVVPPLPSSAQSGAPATDRMHATATAGASSSQVNTQSAGEFTAADFNGDGVLDVASIDGSTLSISLLDTNSNSIGAHTYTLPGEGYTITAADVNGDGKADLIVSLWAPRAESPCCWETAMAYSSGRTLMPATPSPRRP
jgi:hypothetical protein